MSQHQSENLDEALERLVTHGTQFKQVLHSRISDELYHRLVQFVAEIDAFRECVNAKMQWHEQAVQVHNDNARQVVALWNEFVQTSLNAPEDFPWPEEEAE